MSLDGAYAYITVDGNALGWIDTRAFAMSRVVYLDPGHMGVGKGAISTVTGEMVDENTINYRVAVLTKEILEAKGYTVYISKDSINDPIDLPERAAEANALGVDIFVSIHCNTFNSPDASGTLGFWAGEKLNPAVSDWQLQSKTLAQYLSSTVGSVLGKYSAPSDTSYGSSFYVNRETTMPSTLLELGFISNYQDATILNAEASQKDIAVQVAKGIDQFFNVYFSFVNDIKFINNWYNFS